MYIFHQTVLQPLSISTSLHLDCKTEARAPQNTCSKSPGCVCQTKTITQTSSAAQFGGTEGTFSTAANNHNLLLFTQCYSTSVLELVFTDALL